MWKRFNDIQFIIFFIFFFLSRTYSLTGAYRKLLIKPENISWKLQTYENEVNNLILSDMDELNKVTLDEYPGLFV